jgi:hypothetical protein
MKLRFVFDMNGAAYAALNQGFHETLFHIRLNCAAYAALYRGLHKARISDTIKDDNGAEV